MTATLSFRQEPDGSICAKDCSTRAGELQANPDVGGIGVLIGFVATAWLVVLLVVFRYCLAFDPTADPFAKPRRHQRCGLRHALKPNAVDFKITGIFRGLRGRLDHHGFWDMALNKILLKLCDVQLLTGFGLLLSSFISLTCYMSAYHWQIISYLAWFSNLTHAACLTALRQYLYRHQMERNFRMTLMVILLAGLITAIVPTGYFNWGDPGEHNVVNQGTASVPASNARCFFTQRSIQAAWESRLCKENESPEVDYPDGYPCNSKQNYYGKEKTPQATIAYESSIISILLLTLSFSSRSVKMFRILSEIARNTVRHKVGYWASLCLIATAKRYPDLRNTAWRRKFLAVFRPLDLMITFYLVVKLYLDMFLSEMADVFWLLISSLWGTIRLFMSRKSADVHGEEDEWGFGQVLSVFLLLGPITTVIMTVLATFRTRTRSRKQEEDGKSVRQAVSLLDAYRNEITATQRHSNEVLNRVSSLLRDIESDPGTKIPICKGRSSQNELEDIPLDEFQQFPDDAIGAEVDGPLMPVSLSAMHLGNIEGVVTLPNQETVIGLAHEDMRASLSFRFSQSQWMTIVMWFFCFQFLALAIATFWVLAQDSSSPSSLLIGVAFSGFVVQPLNCFIVVALGLYVGDGDASKFQLTLLCVLLFAPLLAWSVVIVFPFEFMVILFKWDYAFAPLLITVIQFLYLSLR